MNRISAAVVAAATLLSSSIAMQAENPFFSPFATEHGTPPFSLIDDTQWQPAIDRGIESARAEIDAIVANPATPDFENTIVALTGSVRVLNSTVCSMCSIHFCRPTAPML